MTEMVTIVEVGTRDGFQSVGPFIPTARKVQIAAGLVEAGIRRIEATSFVSETALPQMADAPTVLEALRIYPELDAQVLIPSARHAARALAAGSEHLSFVLSVSERHNRGNVRRSPLESAEEYEQIVAMLPDGGRLRLNLATAFDCPHDGKIDPGATMALLERLVPVAPSAEVALCDTTGRVTPVDVGSLFRDAASAFPETHWVFHAHDTYGLGAANCLSAWNAGVRIFDASVAGLGGCPFAPGATGNVATEDLVYMFEGMGVSTGIDIGRLVAVAEDVASLPGASVGGRVRDARRAAASLAAERAGNG